MNDWGGEKITLFTINYAPYDTLSHGILLHRLHPPPLARNDHNRPAVPMSSLQTEIPPSALSPPLLLQIDQS